MARPALRQREAQRGSHSPPNASTSEGKGGDSCEKLSVFVRSAWQQGFASLLKICRYFYCKTGIFSMLRWAPSPHVHTATLQQTTPRHPLVLLFSPVSHPKLFGSSSPFCCFFFCYFACNVSTILLPPNPVGVI